MRINCVSEKTRLRGFDCGITAIYWSPMRYTYNPVSSMIDGVYEWVVVLTSNIVPSLSNRYGSVGGGLAHTKQVANLFSAR